MHKLLVPNKFIRDDERMYLTYVCNIISKLFISFNL